MHCMLWFWQHKITAVRRLKQQKERVPVKFHHVYSNFIRKKKESFFDSWLTKHGHNTELAISEQIPGSTRRAPSYPFEKQQLLNSCKNQWFSNWWERLLKKVVRHQTPDHLVYELFDTHITTFNTDLPLYKGNMNLCSPNAQEKHQLTQNSRQRYTYLG